MVECELLKNKLQSVNNQCFNRYMVECELYAFADNPAVLYGFNRYMVECEFYTEEFDILIFDLLF